MAKLNKDHGYGQIELNQVAFRRDGRIEAQCALNITDFTETAPAENGMILVVDKAKNEIRLPKTGDLTSGLAAFAINYTTEHMYDERANALSDFYLVPGTFLPRMGYLSTGERFTTNTVKYETSVAADFKALKELVEGKPATAEAEKIPGVSVYGIASTDGYIELVKTVDEGYKGPVLEVVKCYTMADGSDGIKFNVIKG